MNVFLQHTMPVENIFEVLRKATESEGSIASDIQSDIRESQSGSSLSHRHHKCTFPHSQIIGVKLLFGRNPYRHNRLRGRDVLVSEILKMLYLSRTQPTREPCEPCLAYALCCIRVLLFGTRYSMRHVSARWRLRSSSKAASESSFQSAS